jgi:23S rRNA (adenine2503-C2)-methyltransferase
VLPDIRSQTRDALAEQFKAWNEPAYRLDQLLNWLYTRRAAGWDEMTNLPRALREKLAGAFSLGLPAVTKVQGARDTTRKFLWRLADGSQSAPARRLRRSGGV